MRAVTYRRYGGPDELHLSDVAAPPVQRDDVLVAVRATGVNHWDWDLLTGRPLTNRLGAWRAPRYPVLGSDIAGTVVAVGPEVTGLAVGQRVYGDLSGCGWGGFAEQVSAPADRLLPIPDGISWEEAAAAPQSGALALQALRGPARVDEGHHVCINGAGGGVGTFAVQLAKAYGARVTAVDAGHKLPALRRLGADRAIDYRAEDYTAAGPYDLILDAECHRRVREPRSALNADGIYAFVGGSPAAAIETIGLTAWTAVTGHRRTLLVPHRPNRHLPFLGRLLQQRRVVPLIQEVLPLAEVPRALRLVGEGGITGKIVVDVQG